jgi:hypothetical protein
MNTRRGKPTRREQGLLAHVRRAEARKVPLTQYCRANGLNVQSVYNLRSRLARSKSRPRQVAPGRSKAADPFIAVRVAAPVAPPPAACRLQVKGWVIECASLPSSAWLAGLMAGDTHAVP